MKTGAADRDYRPTGLWIRGLTDDPPVLGQFHGFPFKQRLGALNTMPVLIQGAPLDRGIFLEPDFPPMFILMSNGEASNVAGTTKTEFEHMVNRFRMSFYNRHSGNLLVVSSQTYVNTV